MVARKKLDLNSESNFDPREEGVGETDDIFEVAENGVDGVPFPVFWCLGRRGRAGPPGHVLSCSFRHSKLCVCRGGQFPGHAHKCFFALLSPLEQD